MTTSTCTQPGCSEPSVAGPGPCRGHALARAWRAQRTWGWAATGLAAAGTAVVVLMLVLRVAPPLRLGVGLVAAIAFVVALLRHHAARQAVVRLTAR